MKILEIIQEAHHSIINTIKMGRWTVHLDSHAMVSVAHKGVSLEHFSNIISYSCFLPNVYETVPIGKGVFFQDVNTMISIYVHRLAENELRVETVLPPSEIPKPPMFRRPVPITDQKPTSKITKSMNAMRAASQERGRDAVSQDLEKLAPIYQNLNREERRKMYKMMRRSK